MRKRTPAALIDGVWIESVTAESWEHRNPAQWSEVLSTVAIADRDTARDAVQSVAQLQAAWRNRSVSERLDCLEAWLRALAHHRDEFVRLLALEVGKPRRDAEEEVARTLGHLEAVVRIAREQLQARPMESGSFRIRLRPVGTVLVITPWNNPLAIPVSKLAAAFAFGNGVIWKPALEAPRVTMLAMDCLLRSAPDEVPIAVVFGGRETAACLLDEPLVDAVTFTGSCRAGRELARDCGIRARPFQAEMGGNNPVIVMPDTNLDEVAEVLMPACFSFSGQRCTAVRRLIVEESIVDAFRERFLAAVSRLAIGPSTEPSTTVGPLISRDHRDRVLDLVGREVEAKSCRILAGGTIPTDFTAGAWLAPTVIDAVGSDSPLVRDELFAPVVTIQSCRGIDEAIELANGVEHGLLAGLFSREGRHQDAFLRGVEAGMLKINPTGFQMSADAPFTGWKCSGYGPPEHGECDADFYGKVQVIYS